MSQSITIEKINYFGVNIDTPEFNAKVLYRKYNRLYLAHIYIDFFHRTIHIPKNQPKECRILVGLYHTVNQYAKETNWLFNKN